MSYSRNAMMASELAMLEEMIESIDADRVIERVGLQARRDAIAKELESLSAEPRRVTLTFKGTPVRGSHSIHGDFGGKAAALFSEAVATLDADIATSLGGGGPLPNGDARQLQIVGTAIGSFGFEFELPAAETPTLPGVVGDSMVEAVERTISVIREANGGDDETFSELLGTIHPRATKKLRAFVKHVVDRGARFAVQFGDQRANVSDDGEGSAILDALDEEHIVQEEVTLSATLIGILPEARRFEARTADGLIRGPVDAAMGDLAAASPPWLNQVVTLTLRKTSVAGSRTSYVLLAVKPDP